MEKIEKIPQIRKYEMRQDTKEKNKQLREQKQELKTQTKNTRTKITPQQAYEMQQSSSSLKVKMIFKSEKEKAYENKSNSMEKMIQEMAKLIIEENKEYIGQEVAEEAIADINEQQEGGKEK